MNNLENKTIHITYYARLREERGIDEEEVHTLTSTIQELYKELQGRHNFQLPESSLKASINDTFSPWQAKLKTGDKVVFIPPVSGG